MGKRIGAGIAAAILTASVVGAMTIAGGGAQHDFAAPNLGAWSVQCIHSQPNAYKDPIVYPGNPQTPHLHAFLGNTVDENTTPLDLIGRSSNFCPQSVDDPTNPGTQLPDNTAEWFPCVFTTPAKTSCVGPNSMLVYYRTAGKDPAGIWPYPQQLAMVAGNGKAMEPQTANVGFYCIAGIDRTPMQPTIPDSCPLVGETTGLPYQLKMEVRFPDCVRHGAHGPNWTAALVDGTGLDGQPGVVYAYDNPDQASNWARVCPTGTLAIPQIDFEARVNLDVPGRWPLTQDGLGYDLTGATLASDNMDMGDGMTTGAHGVTLHADFLNGWSDDELWKLVAGCYYPVHRNCGRFGNGPVQR